MNTESILLTITLALWAAGWLVLGRVRRCGGDRANRLSAERLSIIIPARNEEHNLPTLLRSLAAQPLKPGEIIVVDDGSTDRTAELARQLGATVIPSQPLPDGWRGKTWACHQGAQAATGELLLFLDADTWFEPDGLARVLSGYAGGAFSVGPYHAVRKPYEDLSLFFNFNMTVGTVPSGLFGQMLLVDRESYRRVGGHETVKGRILENFWLAEQFRAAGIPVRSVTGRGVFSFRMYPNGLRELIAGLDQGFRRPAPARPRAGRCCSIVAWMIGLMFAPLGGLVTGDWLRWGAAYLLCAAQVGWFSRQVGAFRWFTAVLYPVPLIFFFAVFAWSTLRSGKRVNGKDGRSVRIELPIVWIIVLNVAGWPVIQFGLAWAFTRMPVTWFNPGGAQAWEQGGRFYERMFANQALEGLVARRCALVRRRFCQRLAARTRARLPAPFHPRNLARRTLSLVRPRLCSAVLPLESVVGRRGHGHLRAGGKSALHPRAALQPVAIPTAACPTFLNSLPVIGPPAGPP